jgi:DNA-binding response OmpR family regulator
MNKTKVLVVEDDPNICKLIGDYMNAHGYDVTPVNDGPEALDYIRQRGLPHIALVDLALPTMHGFELSSKLKAMADVPIIFVTSTSDTDTIVQGLKRYAEDFIVKPFELRELEARVQAVLAGGTRDDRKHQGQGESPQNQAGRYLWQDSSHHFIIGLPESSVDGRRRSDRWMCSCLHFKHMGSDPKMQVTSWAGTSICLRT